MTHVGQWSSAANWTNQWLRSPGTNATQAAIVNNNGTVTGSTATQAFGVRPDLPAKPFQAKWICQGVYAKRYTESR